MRSDGGEKVDLAAAKVVDLVGLGSSFGAVGGTVGAVVMVPGGMWRQKENKSVPAYTTYGL